MFLALCTHGHTHISRNGVILYLVICNLLFHLTMSHCLKWSSCIIIYPHSHVSTSAAINSLQLFTNQAL